MVKLKEKLEKKCIKVIEVDEYNITGEDAIIKLKNIKDFLFLIDYEDSEKENKNLKKFVLKAGNKYYTKMSYVKEIYYYEE